MPQAIKSAFWTLGRIVRRRLASVSRSGFVFRAYRLLRTVPGVTWLWRRLFGQASHGLFDLQTYRQSGGSFAVLACRALPDWPETVAQAFPDALVAAAARVPVCANPGEHVVLINCSLTSGGAERQVVLTAKALQEAGRAPVFVGEYVGKAPGLDFFKPDLVRARIPVHDHPPARPVDSRYFANVSEDIAHLLVQAPQDIMIEILEMQALLLHLQPRIVHLWQDQTIIKHSISALLAGVPVIVGSGRNINPTHFSFNQPWLKPGYQALCRLPRFALCNNSSAGATSYEQWLGLPTNSITILRNGVALGHQDDVNALPAQSPGNALGMKEKAPLIGGAFRLSSEKRPLLWLEMAAQVRQQLPGSRFVIAGDGPLKEPVQRHIAALGLGDAVKLLGEVTDMRRFYRALDVLVLASQYEGTPNVLLEAQWHGVPVVTTNAGGAPETVFDAPANKVVKDATPAALAQAVMEACAAPRPDTKITRKWLKSRFGMARLKKDTLALYALAASRAKTGKAYLP